MDVLVPVPNFEYIAQILKPVDLFHVVSKSIDLLTLIRKQTAFDPTWDGFIGNFHVGGNCRPNPRFIDWDFRLWAPWRWTLLSYAYTMSGECQRRGIECKVVPPEFGYNLRLSQLQDTDAEFREHWPGAERLVPDWLTDARLGRQHRAALVAHDVYYAKFWPLEEFE